MSDVEDRLRAELRARSQRIQPEHLRDLEVPPRRGSAGARRRRWLAPAVAALAVAAVVGVLAGVRPTSGRPPAPVAGTTGRPPFYVTVPDTGNLAHPDATVRATATGAVLGRVSVPGTELTAVTAAADDRTFVLAAQRRAPGGGDTTEFYQLTLNARGRPEPLARLPLTVAPGQYAYALGSMALSADGATVALSVEPTTFPLSQPDPSARIEVVALRTGATRTWAAAGWTALGDLSWGSGGTLAFLAPDAQTAQGGYQLRVLDTARPAGRLAGASRPARLSVAPGALLSALVTGHGRVVVAWTRAPAPGPGEVGDAVLAAFSAQTGRRLRVLDTLPSRGAFESYAQVWSADPSGEHLLAGGNAVSGQVTSPGGVVKDAIARVVLHRIDHGRVTALPDPGGLLLDAAW
jgi:hypothetical protein